MKLSRREIFMLIALVIVALVFIEFRFIISPGQEKLETLQEEQLKISAEVQQVDLNLAKLAVHQAKLDENLKAIALISKPYFDQIQSDVLLNFTREILIRNGFTILVYTPNPTVITKIMLPEGQIQERLYQLKMLAQEYNQTEDPGNNENDDDADTEIFDDLELFKVTVSAVGTYDQIKNLFSDIKSQNRAIRINDLTINVGNQPEQLNANFSLEFYGLEKLVDDPSDDLDKWPRDSFDGGTDNPFLIETGTN
jgi:Tfp pilus assembly protein PilO